MGIGYLLCPASMQGGAITGAPATVGMYLVKAGGALIDHIAFLFAVGIGVGMADDGNGAAGAGLYAFLNRLLIPLGLHHALNNVFWFDTIGLGDLTNFWAGKTSADVSWSLGMYMSGFFPCMMFGVPGAALAMVQCAKQNRKSYATGIVASAALCSFVCGVPLYDYKI